MKFGEKSAWVRIISRTKMKLRKRMPRFVQRTFRVAREFVAKPAGSEPLSASLFDGARYFSSRYTLVAALPKANRVLEIDSDTGSFARYILEVLQPDRLDIVDLDFSRFDRD